jgi:hypothetical protein
MTEVSGAGRVDYDLRVDEVINVRGLSAEEWEAGDVGRGLRAGELAGGDWRPGAGA